MEMRARFVQFAMEHTGAPRPGEAAWKAARAEALADLTELATYHYGLIDQPPKPEQLARAIHWHERWLHHRGDELPAPEFRLALAGLLVEAGRRDEAIAQYEQVAYASANARLGEQAAALAFDLRVKRLVGQERLVRLDLVSLRELAPQAQRYLQRYPSSNQAQSAVFDIAWRLNDLNAFDEAADAGRLIIALGESIPSQTRLEAYTWIARQAHRENRLEDASAALTQAVALTGLTEEDRLRARSNLALGLRKQGLGAENEGRFADAARHFSAALVFASGSDAKFLRCDIAIAYGNAADPSAISALREYRRLHDNALCRNEDTHQLLVEELERHKAFLDAAREATAWAQQAKSREERADRLLRASTLAERASGADAESGLRLALELGERHVAQLGQMRPAALPLAEAQVRMQGLWDRAGSPARALEWAKKAYDLTRRRSLCQGDGDRADAACSLGAKAALRISSDLMARYQSIRWDDLDNARQTDAKLRARKAALDTLEFASRMGLGSTETQARFQLGRLAEIHAQQIMRVNLPAGASAAIQEAQRRSADDLTQNAILQHEANRNLLKRSEFAHDEWILRSIAALRDLWPARYAKDELGQDGGFENERN
jgi:cellulose synthase operon protein C